MEKIGSQEVEYKTEEHEEVQAFRRAHDIFMENHPVDAVKHLCQMNADESHLFWFDQSGKTFTLPDEAGGQAKRVRGGRMGLTITPVSTPTTKGRLQVIVRSKLIGEKRFLLMQNKYSNVLKLVRYIPFTPPPKIIEIGNNMTQVWETITFGKVYFAKWVRKH